MSPERIISVHSLSLANARLLPEALCIRRLVIGDIIASMASCASLPFTRAFPVSGYSAGLTNRRPSLLCIPGLCDRAAAPTPESSLGIFARHFPTPRDPAFAACLPARHSRFPQLPSRGSPFRCCSNFVMLRPGRSLAPLGSPVLRRRGLYPRSFHRGGHPASMFDLLRGCQAVTAADPSSAGLRWLQAARASRGNSPGRTHTDWACDVTGCNPDPVGLSRQPGSNETVAPAARAAANNPGRDSCTPVCKK